MVEFRWVVALTLWTVLSGPVLVEWTMAGHGARTSRPASSKPISPAATSYVGAANNCRPTSR
jgi:hypothetical protein